MKNKKSIAILMAAITLASCQSYKKVPYLQSYESLTDKSYKEIVINEVNQQDTLYDARIQPKDLLNITINTTDPQAAAPFNLTMQTYNNIAQSNASTTSQPALQQYLVDNAGEIDFPVIGRLQVGGLTKNAAENLIREQLRPYLGSLCVEKDCDRHIKLFSQLFHRIRPLFMVLVGAVRHIHSRDSHTA